MESIRYPKKIGQQLRPFENQTPMIVLNSEKHELMNKKNQQNSAVNTEIITERLTKNSVDHKINLLNITCSRQSNIHSIKFFSQNTPSPITKKLQSNFDTDKENAKLSVISGKTS